MKLNTLDLHGKRHHEVDLVVENFIYLNQEDCPLLIICGNSQKMISLVVKVLDRVECVYEKGKGHNYGTVIVRKI
ncbi:MAG: hypothetical protein ACJ0BD_00620 [Gammaproteobacteria bacterium]|tara:strand:- start:196 stop:420 length:225 start_codon:yes stop_codon:yes gene_type:complete